LTEPTFRSGFAALVGRPNVGKSTLLNQLLGEKVVITSDKPQTTRNRIQGILTSDSSQTVFVDTPGIHVARSRINRMMVESALSAVRDVDVVLFLVEADAEPNREEKALLEVLAKATAPVLLVINKIDRVAKETLLARIAAYGAAHPFREIVPISALNGDGVELLARVVAGYLPEGPPYFPDDQLTDVPERFIVAEMVREQVFRLTRDEIPYAVAVTIDAFTERPGQDLVAISATIHVERDSQKGVIIGQRGAMLKKIGSNARREIEKFLNSRVFLELFVRVSHGWSESPGKLKEFGYE
jgi:GTP-binding protein Era